MIVVSIVQKVNLKAVLLVEFTKIPILIEA